MPLFSCALELLRRWAETARFASWPAAERKRLLKLIEARPAEAEAEAETAAEAEIVYALEKVIPDAFASFRGFRPPALTLRTYRSIE